MMKLKVFSSFISIVLIALLLVGCTSVPKTTIKVSCSQFEQAPKYVYQITVYKGSSLTVTLCSNPSTGFEWPDTPENNNTAVLSQSSHKTISSTSDVVGAAGEEVWTFDALETGLAVVEFDYSKPGIEGEKEHWTVRIEATVKEMSK
jgi:inhibitor of cysteine peptidase